MEILLKIAAHGASCLCEARYYTDDNMLSAITPRKLLYASLYLKYKQAYAM